VSREPHDAWAGEYDLVLERTFGPAYAAFTELTLGIILERVPAPARVVDFGAGTGRLALPLANAGYRVTAVDPSRPMLARLAEKEGLADEERYLANKRASGDGGRGCTAVPACPVRRVVSHLEAYRGREDHDLALCVFSVIGYLLDEETLQAASRVMASSVRAGGRLLVDIPGPDVFEGFEVETDDVLRYVEMERVDVPGPGEVYDYRERTAVRTKGRERRYEDSFRVRRWPRDVVETALSGAGFEVEEDLSARFAEWGAGYLLLRRTG
jgi:SAM-dependent methyltransferase